jgi:hypothetical protein
MKFCNLVIGELPKHPQYDVKYVKDLKLKAVAALDSLDRLKKYIKQEELKPKKENEELVVKQEKSLPKGSKIKESTQVIINNDPNWWKTAISSLTNEVENVVHKENKLAVTSMMNANIPSNAQSDLSSPINPIKPMTHDFTKSDARILSAPPIPPRPSELTKQNISAASRL